MKIDNPINENYAASIVRINTLTALDGLDNLRALPVFGMQALVPKDYEPGTLGVLIPTEAQVSHEFATANNLYRDSTLNADTHAKGYLEPNRRVKAIKLRGHRSNALFLPLTSLDYLGIDTSLLDEGMTFDHINGKEVVRKYVIKEPIVRGAKVAKPQREDLIDGKLFPLHVESDNFWRNEHAIPNDARLIVSQKLHGTSSRFGRVPAPRTLTLIERIAKRLGARVQDIEYAFVVGSRKVVKSVGGKEREGVNSYYDGDVWSQVAAPYKNVIPDGYIVYGEIVGWVEGGKPIQRGYTYEVPAGDAHLYVYRVATINPQGRLLDLTWEQVKAFCREHGLKWVPEFDVTTPGEFVVESYMDVNYTLDTVRLDGFDARYRGGERPVPLPAGTVDEGVVIRVEPREGGQPWFLKAKCQTFLEAESKALDTGIPDLESVEA